MELMDVVAARSVMNRGSKSELKVVVYTPLVTVPALPVILPVIVCENVLFPEKRFESVRRVEEAAVMMMFPVPSKETPLMVRALCNALAVPALPETEPVIVCEKTFEPVNVLAVYVFGRVVEESTKYEAEVVEKKLRCDAR